MQQSQPRKRTPELYIEVAEFKRRTEECRVVIRDLQQAIQKCPAIKDAATGFMDALQTAVREKSKEYAKVVGVPEHIYTKKAFEVLGLTGASPGASTGASLGAPLAPSASLGASLGAPLAPSASLDASLDASLAPALGAPLAIEGFAVLPAQDAATVELQRYVGILEALMSSIDFAEAQAALQDSDTALRVSESLLSKGVLEMPTAQDFRDGTGCPPAMWGFQDAKAGALCCPIKPRNDKCTVKRIGTRYMCAPESNKKAVRVDSQVPVCVPQPQQGPCLADYFFFGRAAGGACCPVKPTGYQATTNDFTICPQAMTGGNKPRTICALTKNSIIGKALPLCPEGFQGGTPTTAAYLEAAELRGKDLLDYTDDLFKTAGDFANKIQKADADLRAANRRFSESAENLPFRLGPAAPAPAPAPKKATPQTRPK